MSRKKGKSVSFDAMVKFFMQNYNIPTKTDLDRIEERLDRLEHLLRSDAGRAKSRRFSGAKSKIQGVAKKARVASATDSVLKVIKGLKNGAGISQIQKGTGFDEKKIRNVLYRLHKDGAIKRTGRGIYTAS